MEKLFCGDHVIVHGLTAGKQSDFRVGAGGGKDLLRLFGIGFGKFSENGVWIFGVKFSDMISLPCVFLSRKFTEILRKIEIVAEIAL